MATYNVFLNKTKVKAPNISAKALINKTFVKNQASQSLISNRSRAADFGRHCIFFRQGK
jgi:hypothetical protein